MHQIKTLLKIILVWWLLHTITLIAFACWPREVQGDLGVVLGTTVEPNGVPSLRLQRRLDRAIDLYWQQRLSLIMVSGGIGREGYPEGDKMRDYLIEKGIPADRIIVDNEGVNTRATARNAAQWCREHQVSRVVVVSQYFHLLRCCMLLEKAGIQHPQPATANYFELRDLYGLVREFAAFYTQI